MAWCRGEGGRHVSENRERAVVCLARALAHLENAAELRPDLEGLLALCTEETNNAARAVLLELDPDYQEEGEERTVAEYERADGAWKQAYNQAAWEHNKVYSEEDERE